MTPEHYDGFLDKCFTVDRLPEYSILKSGVIIHRQIGGMERRIIVILCEESQAHTLLNAARTLSVPAAEDLVRAMDPLREL